MQKKSEKSTELIKIGQRIKELRITKGYTSHETFAYDSNISRSQFWRYENGEDLKMSTFLKILKSLNVSPEEFFSK